MRLNVLMCVLSLLLSTSAPAGARGGDEDKGSPTAVTGTVKFIDLEGGFYGIIADTGEKYLPLNLDQQFKVDGMRVRFEGKVRKGMPTVVMWGTPMEILKIEAPKGE